MGWYDIFSRFYDSSLEKLYREQRQAAVQALRLAPGLTVLDLPCGTGQSFDDLVPPLGETGALVGIDASAGMLGRARQRVERNEWNNVKLLQEDVHAVDAQTIERAVGQAQVDRLHLFLGLSAFPRWEQAFEGLWNLLADDGRCVIVDVHAARPGFQGHMVNLVARADIRRTTWVPLERLSSGFERRDLPSLPDHGGQIFLASGTKG